jgi:hypothetical protein
VPIVQQFQMSGQDPANDDSKLEFDLYDLPNQKLKELHNYVEACLNGQPHINNSMQQFME